MVMRKALGMEMSGLFQQLFRLGNRQDAQEQHYLLALVQMTAANCRLVCRAVTRSSSCEQASQSMRQSSICQQSKHSQVNFSYSELGMNTEMSV